ncbi:MAG TPA: glycosyltransferase family 2 protein [Solirubrobacterales bacterium]|nr:glycosyltransferase family 2 protein [Solirubrobacterales bacterium]
MAPGGKAGPGSRGVSVIVPIYEGWPILSRTLAALLRDLRGLRLPWQLLLVDNESSVELIERVSALQEPGEDLRVLRRRRLGGRHFQPGAARNIGIAEARYDCLVFLDADCVPGAGMLEIYAELTLADPETVFLGHREFVSSEELSPAEIAADRSILQRAPRVGSRSNYGHPQDRRLAELLDLDGHPRPYDCLYGCNFALHRSCLGSVRFDPAYDGYWGYEDIDLGFRLHQRGRRFRYVPEAFVFHQEGTELSREERAAGRLRNLAIFASRCPGFVEYRGQSRRAGALPDQLRAGALVNVA